MANTQKRPFRELTLAASLKALSKKGWWSNSASFRELTLAASLKEWDYQTGSSEPWTFRELTLAASLKAGIELREIARRRDFPRAHARGLIEGARSVARRRQHGCRPFRELTLAASLKAALALSKGRTKADLSASSRSRPH